MNQNFNITLILHEDDDPEKESKSDRCGEKDGVCRKPYCCSQYGYCGDTTEHCGVGCNPLYGLCKEEGMPGQCGYRFGSCPNNGCCSEYGYCGTSDAYCGKGCQKQYGRCNSE